MCLPTLSSFISLWNKGTLENDHKIAKHFTARPTSRLCVLTSDYPGVDKGDLIDNFIFQSNDIEPHIGKKEILIQCLPV